MSGSLRGEGSIWFGRSPAGQEAIVGTIDTPTLAPRTLAALGWAALGLLARRRAA